METILCPKCKKAMEVGIALQQKERERTGERAEYNFIINSNLILKDCLKCPECGHSENYENL